MDTSHIERFPRRPFDFYVELGRQIVQGSFRVFWRFFNEPTQLPREPEALLEYVRRMHEAQFQDGEPWMAGRFRDASEDDVVVGGDHSRHHMIDCERPSLILERLSALMTTLPLDDIAEMERWKLSKVLAVWLEDFFRIHPFNDGNGRIGRLFLEALVHNESRRYRMTALGKGRTYRRALEYAHRHSPRSLDELKKRGHGNPCVYLTRWICPHLEVLDEEPEMMPPSLTPGPRAIG